MRISDLDESFVLRFLHLDESELGDDLDPMTFLEAAKSFARGYTGLTDDEMDQHEDLTVAVLVLCADLYEQRTMTVDTGNLNRTVDTILNLYRVNYL